MPRKSDDPPGEPHRDAHCYASVKVPGRVESIRFAARFIIGSARHMRVPAAFEPLFETAVVEALNNAVKHGTSDQRPDPAILCEMELVGQSFTLRILDEGTGFVLPHAPRLEWSADDIATVPEGGYGISLIQEVFPRVRTIERPDGFGLEMALTF